MSTLSGGHAKTIHPTTLGLPCVHCQKDVNVAPYRIVTAGKAKVRPHEPVRPRGEEVLQRVRRPNPVRSSLISRVVCSECYKEGKR